MIGRWIDNPYQQLRSFWLFGQAKLEVERKGKLKRVKRWDGGYQARNQCPKWISVFRWPINFRKESLVDGMLRETKRSKEEVVIEDDVGSDNQAVTWHDDVAR